MDIDIANQPDLLDATASAGEASLDPAARNTRPRIEGEREEQILDAALAILVDAGYDKLTMDAVATQAHASKATLYRRWDTKADLVVDALCRAKGALQLAAPDTGSLRGDLIAMSCGHGGVGDEHVIGVMASVVTAIHRDPAFAEAFYAKVIAPKIIESRTVFEQARARGELRPGANIDLLAHALPAIVLHRAFVLQEPVDDRMVVSIIDEVVLPAAVGCPGPVTSSGPGASTDAQAHKRHHESSQLDETREGL